MKQSQDAIPGSQQQVVGLPTSISYRAHDWYDTKKRTGRYGIQAKAVGYECRWLHCAENGEPLLFDTEAERDAKLKELRRRSNNQALRSVPAADVERRKESGI